MSTRITDDLIFRVSRGIKIFLNNTEKVQKIITASSFRGSVKKAKPVWLSKYNFQSLLNVPAAMKLFGPILNLREGLNQGEGYLIYTKLKITNIHSKNR